MGIYNPKSKKSMRLRRDESNQLVLDDGSSVATDTQIAFFYITKQYGSTLSQFYNDLNKRSLNLLSIYELGLRLIDLLEMFHNAGLIHNDLSLEKIILGQN